MRAAASTRARSTTCPARMWPRSTSISPGCREQRGATPSRIPSWSMARTATTSSTCSAPAPASRSWACRHWSRRRIRRARTTRSSSTLSAATTRSAPAPLPAGIAKLTIDARRRERSILGSRGADILLGGDGNDFIDGNQGDDEGFLGCGQRHIRLGSRRRGRHRGRAGRDRYPALQRVECRRDRRYRGERRTRPPLPRRRRRHHGPERRRDDRLPRAGRQRRSSQGPRDDVSPRPHSDAERQPKRNRHTRHDLGDGAVDAAGHRAESVVHDAPRQGLLVLREWATYQPQRLRGDLDRGIVRWLRLGRFRAWGPCRPRGDGRGSSPPPPARPSHEPRERPAHQGAPPRHHRHLINSLFGLARRGTVARCPPRRKKAVQLIGECAAVALVPGRRAASLDAAPAQLVHKITHSQALLDIIRCIERAARVERMSTARSRRTRGECRPSPPGPPPAPFP